jgi:metal-responsive CopG/Arc/MetJ family transcriptional regulator
MEIAKIISISIPKPILNQIDSSRGDINRSKFILKLIESNFKNCLIKETQNQIGSL